MSSSPAHSAPHSPRCNRRHTRHGGTLATTPPVALLFTQEFKQLLADTQSALVAFLPGLTARARAMRDNSGSLPCRECRTREIHVDHITHVDGSLGCLRHHSAEAFA